MGNVKFDITMTPITLGSCAAQPLAQQVAVTTLTEQLAAQLPAHTRGIRSMSLCSVGKISLTDEYRRSCY